MNTQVTQLLTQLSKTLGTTIEYLWSVEVKQSFIDGILNFAWCVLLIASLIGLYKLAKWSYGKVIEIADLNKDKDYYSQKIESDGYIAISILSSFAIVVCVIFIGIDFSSGIGHMFNPQHYALENILSYVTGK